MSRPAKYLTRADRAHRREKIVAALRAGGSLDGIAALHGLSRRYIAQIAKDSGLASPVGRPQGTRAWRECPEHMHKTYDHFIRKMKLPAAYVRELLEAA